MKDNIYCIYDRLSGRYGSVFSSPTHATASIQFSNLFKQSPDDKKNFDLCCIAQIAISTGETTTQALQRIDTTPEPSTTPIHDIEKSLES